jgi:hypothetical protein
VLGELAAVLRPFWELVIDEDTAALLVSMSAATVDRRLAPEQRKQQPKGRGTTKPGSLLKRQIPVRTWADWENAQLLKMTTGNAGSTTTASQARTFT